jgi:hypothetical protein
LPVSAAIYAAFMPGAKIILPCRYAALNENCGATSAIKIHIPSPENLSALMFFAACRRRCFLCESMLMQQSNNASWRGKVLHVINTDQCKYFCKDESRALSA